MWFSTLCVFQAVGSACTLSLFEARLQNQSIIASQPLSLKYVFGFCFAEQSLPCRRSLSTHHTKSLDPHSQIHL